MAPIVASFKHVKAEIHVSKINKSSSYFTENTLLLHYKDQFINAVQKNCRVLFWESVEADKYFFEYSSEFMNPTVR